jgi:hypothetical protein
MIEISGGRIHRRDKRIWFVMLGVFAAVFLFTFLSGYFKANDEEVNAASLANFDPGYIISDWQMGNYTSMSEAEIQSFLTSKNSCPNRDYNYYLRLSANTNYKWHWDNGHFICLSEERFGDGEVIGSGDTAAHIIWQAAQDYKINPQALLVLLQKETGLITDPIPNNGDYRKATGYGCPDTAPCSSQYYGFKNQIRKAAALFRTVLDGGWTNYPLGNNYVQYNPNPDCGGSVVNIRSLATSALYRYTPYQPNAGAITAGYGTAYCGAYGNRNFYLYFQDWFGGITGDGYRKLDSPRYMELKKDTNRINPYTGEIVDTLEAGMIRKYNTKTVSNSGEWCLRTEYSTANNVDACVLISDLKEIELLLEEVPEEEQRKIITNDAKKIEIRTGETIEVSDFLIRKFVKKTEFLGETYYITEFDADNNRSEFGISERFLKDAYDNFDVAKKYVVITDDTQRIDPYSGSVYDVLGKSRVIEFGAETTIDGTKYYQTENNRINNINAAVAAKDLVLLSEYPYENFINPRKMMIAQQINRINPYTNEYYDTLDAGKIIKFSSKILLDGQWYYRTEHNTINNIDAVVPAWAVSEK